MSDLVYRNVTQDAFGFNEAVASKYLDSFSVFDWGRMPDAIPNRGRFQSFMQAFVNLKISSSEEWLKFLRSPDALAFRKSASNVIQNGAVSAQLNELADSFPMKSSDLGIISEENFKAGTMDRLNLTSEVIQKGESCYLLNESFPEEKVIAVSLMGKTAWDFSAWKNNSGSKALPFEFDCLFTEEFPTVTLRCPQKTISDEVSMTEALLITDLGATQLQEVTLRSAWIAAFIQFQLKSITPIGEKKTIRIRMGFSRDSEFVFLGSSLEFFEIEAELRKYYANTVWGKTVNQLQQQARSRGSLDWKRQCTEPAPWLDQQMKNNLSLHYQKMISGIAACLSE